MSISSQELIRFFKSGYNPFINPNESTVTLFERLKTEPDEIVGNKISGFYYYDYLRFGYTEDGQVDHFGLDMNRCKETFHFHIEWAEKEFTLSSDTVLHEFLHFLNLSKINWDIQGGKPHFGISVKTEGATTIRFDPTDGKIDLIYRTFTVD